jgi:hypothetical protein
LQATEACKTAEEARKEAEIAQKQAEVEAKAVGTRKAARVIAKPKATEISEGTNRLRRAMGLMDDKPTYLAIQVLHLIIWNTDSPALICLGLGQQSTIRELVHQVRLDLRAEYRHQPVKELGDLFKMVSFRRTRTRLGCAY